MGLLVVYVVAWSFGGRSMIKPTSLAAFIGCRERLVPYEIWGLSRNLDCRREDEAAVGETGGPVMRIRGAGFARARAAGPGFALLQIAAISRLVYF